LWQELCENLLLQIRLTFGGHTSDAASKIRLHGRLKILELGSAFAAIKGTLGGSKNVSGLKFISLAKCMAMTLGSKEHCLKLHHKDNKY
jgi:hypothetical protein